MQSAVKRLNSINAILIHSILLKAPPKHN